MANRSLQKLPPKKFIRQSGCIVRDHIPISFRLWKTSNPSEERDAVPERGKKWCWREFKMVEQLQSFKKILTKKYIKTGTTPVFIGVLEKLRGHWDTFVQHKSSELGFRRCRRPKIMPRRKCTITLYGREATSLQYPNGRRWGRICLTEASNL